MRAQPALFLAAALALLGCGGPNGTISGKVTFEGGDGKVAGIPVIAYGPISAAAATSNAGTFTMTGLADGDYVVKAVVEGAEPSAVTWPVNVTGGRASSDPNLVFKFPGGKVQGKIVFADMGDASNLTVLLSGTASRVAKTGMDGSYSFDKLPAGPFVLSVEAPSTLEGRQSASVGVTGVDATQVPDLIFTPVGSIQGTVASGSTPVAGARVDVAGTSLSAVSDEQGKFLIRSVPTGMRTLVASALGQTAQAQATVTKGSPVMVSLMLGGVPMGTGTVNGVVTFAGTESPTLIRVGVAEIPALAPVSVSSTGAFTLTLQPGTWTLTASAPSYPTQVLGTVSVRAGAATVGPSTQLSLFLPYFDPLSAVTSLGLDTDCAGGRWSLVRMELSGHPQQHWLVNSDTRERRLVHIGPLVSALFSAQCTNLAFVVASGAEQHVFTYHLPSAALNARTVGDPVGPLLGFSTDESTLFIPRGGTQNELERVLMSDGTVTRFPVTAVLRHTPDRYLARNGPEVKLVTPTADRALFTNVNAVSATPTPWAVTDCSTACMFKTVAPNTDVANDIQNVGSAGAATLIDGSNADYPVFSLGGTYKIVRTAGGQQPAQLPAGTNFVRFSPDGQRLLYAATQTGTTSLYEEVMPPPASRPAAIATSMGGTFTGKYVAKNRAVLLDTSTAMPRVLDLKGQDGMPITTTQIGTPITDVRAASFRQVGSATGWIQTSNSRWRFIVGEGEPTLAGPAGATTALISAPPVLVPSAPPVALVSFESAMLPALNAFYVDTQTTMATAVPNVVAENGVTARAVAPMTWWFAGTRLSGKEVHVALTSRQLIDTEEPHVQLPLKLGVSRVTALMTAQASGSARVYFSPLR